jgi:hypothetical protein
VARRPRGKGDLLLGEPRRLARDNRGRGRADTLKPWATVGLALACVGALGVGLSERRGLPFHPEDKSYGALRDRAQDFVRSLGPISPKDDARDGYKRTRAAVHYWYRVSPTYVPPASSDDRFLSLFTAPALETPGEKALRFDVQGRLLEYRALPADSGGATEAGIRSPRASRPRTGEGDVRPPVAGRRRERLDRRRTSRRRPLTADRSRRS